MNMFSKFFMVLFLVPSVLLITQSCKGRKNVNTKDLILYVGGGCPYCTKVTNFLSQNNISIPIKDVWNDSASKKELLAMTGGKGQVPCLKINEKEYMHESLDIINKLKEIFKQ